MGFSLLPDRSNHHKRTCEANSVGENAQGGSTLLLKIRGTGSIVWGQGFLLGKYILGLLKNIDLDNS